MMNLVDELLHYCCSCSQWVEQNRSLFFNNQKSLIEYHEMNLFNNEQDISVNLEFLSSNYDPTDSYKYGDIYFRAIEKEAIFSLLINEHHDSIKTITSIHKKGFVFKLLNQNLPLEILVNRDYLYIITHDLFYSSVFGRNIAAIEYIFRDISKAKLIFELGFLLTIKHKDIDVLMELLCCLFIVGIEEQIEYWIMESIVVFVGMNCHKDGSIGQSPSGKHLFSEVYHTSLVGCILYSQLKKRYDRQNHL